MKYYITNPIILALGCFGFGSIVLAHNPVDHSFPTQGRFVQENKADNLRALFQQLNKATSTGDINKAAAATRGLLPDEIRLKKALRDDISIETFNRILSMHKSFSSSNEQQLAKLFATDPARTVVHVHAATTEELIRYAEGSVAFKEFPGGAQRVAKQILRPKMTFYEVELAEPGKDAGMKYHLFFWDGRQWTMLGPIWRVSQ